MSTPDAELDQAEQAEQPADDLTPEILANLGVIPDPSSLVSATEFFPWTRKGSETYLRGATVKFRTIDGQVEQRKIAEQAILSTTGSKEAAEARFKRLELLKNAGVPTPTIYGLRGADVFTEFIPDLRDPEQGIRMINSATNPTPFRLDLLSQLSGIAAGLDVYGFRPTDSSYMLKDLLFDGERFMVTDTGSDLGDPDPTRPTDISFRALAAKIDPSLLPTLTGHYQHARESMSNRQSKLP